MRETYDFKCVSSCNGAQRAVRCGAVHTARAPCTMEQAGGSGVANESLRDVFRKSERARVAVVERTLKGAATNYPTTHPRARSMCVWCMAGRCNLAYIRCRATCFARCRVLSFSHEMLGCCTHAYLLHLLRFFCQLAFKVANLPVCRKQRIFSPFLPVSMWEGVEGARMGLVYVSTYVHQFACWLKVGRRTAFPKEKEDDFLRTRV